MPGEFEEAPVQRVRAGARRDVDQRRRLAAELGGVLRLLNLELLDRVHRWIDHQVVEQLVGHLRAVEQIDVVTRPLAADVGERPGLLQRVAACASRRDHHRVAQLGQRQEVAAVERQLHDLAVFDDVADFGVGRLQQRRFRADDHRLGWPADLELEVEGDHLTDLEDQAGPHEAPEAGELGGDCVGADTQRRQQISSCLVRHSGDSRAALEMLRDNRGARQCSALRVAHDAGNLPGVGLPDAAAAADSSHTTMTNDRRANISTSDVRP